jgi:hypothetical protein
MIASLTLASLLPDTLARSVGFDVPVDPTAPEGREWLREELAKQEYQAARPTWFDQLAKWIQDRIGDLLGSSTTGGPPGFGAVIVFALVLAAIVVAFFVFGRPRINRKSAVSGALFGEDDFRDAAGIRAAAESAAARGEYELAITEAFRAIARGLAERTILTVNPGSTARDFSERAGVPFPQFAAEFAAAAVIFDEVRYLGRPGTAEHYEQVATLERLARQAKPVTFDESSGPSASAGLAVPT